MGVLHAPLPFAHDGVDLHGEVWRPDVRGPVPALLMRTPYGSWDAQRALYPHPSVYAEEGYAVVVQDVRGRWRSGGRFEPFRHEAADGVAAIGWLAAQPWCDGRVGMYGMSYPGAAQLLAATGRPPALRAIAPAMTASDLWSGWFYEHGVLNLSLVPYWAAILALDTAARADDPGGVAELRELCAHPQEIYDRYDHVAVTELLGEAGRRYAPYLAQWLEHPRRDPYWDGLAPPTPAREFDVPGLHVGGWFDVLLTATLDTYCRLAEGARAPQHLVLGPWAHEPWSAIVGDRDLGDGGGSVVHKLQLRWFDHWLRGAELALAPVTVFVLGSNRWREEEAWPPRGGRVARLHLRASAPANSLGGGGWLAAEPPDIEPHDRFLHDPRAPMRTVGGRGCSIDNGQIVGPRDQRGQEARSDVLVYDGAPAERPVLVAGEVRAELYVSRPEVSADFVARLVHVACDGSTFGVTDAVARVTAAGATTSPTAEVEAAAPDVLALRMTLGHCCLAVGPGERLRVEICGSSFPRWERNWSGHPPILDPLSVAEATQLQCVFHEARYPSAVLLPVLEGSLGPFRTQ